MHLTHARLCLNCDEVHAAAACPVCASEEFVYLRRWVTPGVGRPAPPEPSPEVQEKASAYEQLLAADSAPPRTGRFLRQGALGLAAFGFGRWALTRTRRNRQAERRRTESSRTDGSEAP